MVIVINTTTPDFTGEPFVIDLFEKLSDLNPQHHFFFITTDDFNETGSHFIKLKNKFKQGAGLLKKIKYQFELKKKIKRLRPDILITSSLISGLPSSVRQFVLASESLFSNEKHDVLKQLIKTQGVITPSTAWSQKLIDKGLAAEKILTIQPLIDRGIHHTDALSEHRLIEQPFLLLIDKNPDKERMVLILKAFSAFKKRLKSSMKLLIPVNDTTKIILESLVKSYKYRNDVLIVSIPDFDVLSDYASKSYAVIINSDQYGFDNPTSVFVAAGAVIIASDNIYNSVKEYAGDHAFYYHAAEIDALSDILIRLFKDEELRNRFKQTKTREELNSQIAEQLSNLSTMLFLR